MDLSRLPKLKLNNIDLIPLYIVGEGVGGLTIALTTKNNSTKFPLLICKIIKEIDNNSKPFINKYQELEKYDITPRLLGVQTLKKSFKFYGKNNIDKTNECTYRNYVYYFEIGGICTLTQYLSLLTEFKFENIDYLKLYYENIIKNITKINKELGLIHKDFHCSNIMIKNDYTIYLFDIFNKYDKIKNNKNKPTEKQEYLKILRKYLFDINGIKKELNDKNIIEHTELKNLIKTDKNHYTNKNIVSFIDWDFSIDINKKFTRYIDKYNVKNQDVKNIIQLLYNIIFNIDIKEFLFDLMIRLDDIKSIKRYNQNITILLESIENKYEEILKIIILNTELLKNIKNECISYYVINDITNMCYNINKTNFDYIFNYIYSKQYLKDKSYLYQDKYWHSQNNFHYYIELNPIELTEKEKKKVYI